MNSPASAFITLGTIGGPEADAARSQPANALIVGDNAYLVDAGDGAVGQLAKAGVPLPKIKGVFISHLHFDHTAGLLAVIGLRFQMGATQPLAIYGPPGTKEFVNGLIASMQPEARTGYGMPGEVHRDPAASVIVTEILDGDSLTLGAFKVRARGNTHYTYSPTADRGQRSLSLSYRFDLHDRSIVYTGDTGPSTAVADLATGADLLVSEMIDVDSEESRVRAIAPPAQAELVISHLRAHHLTPSEVGDLARIAGVKSVVVTHLSGLPAPGSNDLYYLTQIRQEYSGPVAIAEDLDRF